MMSGAPGVSHPGPASVPSERPRPHRPAAEPRVPVSVPSRHQTALPRWARGSLLLAAGLFLLWAAAARLAGLDGMVVWHDEVFTLVRAFGHSESDIQATLFSGRLLSPGEVLVLQGPDPTRGWDAALAAFASHPEHAPLYYALARLSALSLAPFGVDPVSAARGVSAVAGILIIPAAFVLARVLFGGGAAPWAAALLAAASPMLFLYAQEARQYSLWVLMVALSTAALVWAVRPQRGAWSLAALRGDCSRWDSIPTCCFC